jgi:general secretion pathway protein H
MARLKNLAIKYLAAGTYNKPSVGSGRSRMTAKGFTLIELLIVLVIIGIVVASVSLNLVHRNHSGFSSKASINLLRTRMLLAEQQAIILNKTIGLSLSQKGYQFSNYKGAGTKAYWEVIHDTALKSQTWPLGISMVLKTQGERLPLVLPADFEVLPQIIFSSSGEVSAFSLYIDNQYTLASTTANDFIITLSS